MRILNDQNIEVMPDLTRGYLEEDMIYTRSLTPEEAGVSPDGYDHGQVCMLPDGNWLVWDETGVWKHYERIQRYVLYPAQEEPPVTWAALREAYEKGVFSA